MLKGVFFIVFAKSHTYVVFWLTLENLFYGLVVSLFLKCKVCLGLCSKINVCPKFLGRVLWKGVIEELLWLLSGSTMQRFSNLECCIPFMLWGVYIQLNLWDGTRLVIGNKNDLLDAFSLCSCRSSRCLYARPSHPSPPPSFSRGCTCSFFYLIFQCIP